MRRYADGRRNIRERETVVMEGNVKRGRIREREREVLLHTIIRVDIGDLGL